MDFALLITPSMLIPCFDEGVVVGFEGVSGFLSTSLLSEVNVRLVTSICPDLIASLRSSDFTDIIFISLPISL